MIDVDFEIEDILIKNKINLNKKDIRGRTPIFYFFVKIGNPLHKGIKDPIELF